VQRHLYIDKTHHHCYAIISFVKTAHIMLFLLVEVFSPIERFDVPLYMFHACLAARWGKCVCTLSLLPS
jgi:hypothetical protein